MPRKALTPEQELAGLRAQEATLQEKRREIERALRKNASQQRDIAEKMLERDRYQLGRLAQESGLTLEALKDLLTQGQAGAAESELGESAASADRVKEARVSG